MLNKLPKILTYIFLIVFLLQLAGLVVLLVLPEQGQAINFKPQVKIPGAPEGVVTGTSIGEYIFAIYNYAIRVVGILAVVVMMVGGMIWIMAGGNAERIGSAKAWIGAALTGLLLTLSSWMILNTIDPELVKIQSINPIKAGKMVVCCNPSKGGVTPIESRDNNQIAYTCPTGSTPCKEGKICIKTERGFRCVNISFPDGCADGQGLCYPECPATWIEVDDENNDCEWTRCCSLYSGHCETPLPKGLGGSCKERCIEGQEIENSNGYCTDDNLKCCVNSF